MRILPTLVFDWLLGVISHYYWWGGVFVVYHWEGSSRFG